MANKDEVRFEVKKLLEKFGAKLKDVKTSSAGGTSKGESVRVEHEGLAANKEFRTIMLKNAPRADEDSIIVEKGTWI